MRSKNKRRKAGNKPPEIIIAPPTEDKPTAKKQCKPKPETAGSQEIKEPCRPGNNLQQTLPDQQKTEERQLQQKRTDGVNNISGNNQKTNHLQVPTRTRTRKEHENRKQADN